MSQNPRLGNIGEYGNIAWKRQQPIIKEMMNEESSEIEKRASASLPEAKMEAATIRALLSTDGYAAGELNAPKALELPAGGCGMTAVSADLPAAWRR